MAEEKIYLYPIWLRIWHGVNAILIMLLIATGISMQYADPDYPLIRFDWAVSIHNISGIILAINYVIFLPSNLATKNRRYYIDGLKNIGPRMMRMIKYYLTEQPKKLPSPFPVTKENKFNPLQAMTYSVVMVFFLPVVITTGLALLFPETIAKEVFGYSGIFLTALLHSAIGFLISIFLIIHIYVCTTGKKITDNFKGIITGYHHIHK
jgi:thiosulfate reductase cytochrome b subunit